MSDEPPQKKNEPRITQMTRITKIPSVQSVKSVVRTGGVEK